MLERDDLGEKARHICVMKYEYSTLSVQQYAC